MLCRGILFLVESDSLLLEPLFQLYHFALEDFVVVIFFEFADVGCQFGLVLDYVTQLFFELVANLSQVVEIYFQAQDAGESSGYGFGALWVVAVYVSGDGGDETCHSQTVFVAVCGHVSDDAGRASVVCEVDAVVVEGFLKLVIGDRTEESWFSGVGDKACDAPYKIYGFYAELSAKREDALGKLVPVYIGFSA